jgi:hypothetical protein
MKRIFLTATILASLAVPAAAADSITGNYGDGQVIKLDDGSVWKVNPVDTLTSRFWSVGDDVVVGASDDKLINVDDGEEVEATRLR